MVCDQPTKSSSLFERFPFWACLGCGLALVIFAVQQPFGLMTAPDNSYHLAKIHRAQEGMFFVDPFQGTLSVYPALFHIIFGTANRIMGLNAYALWKVVELVQFSLLLLGFYYFARSVIRSSAVLACSVLALSLVVYAPTGRYILGAEPANLTYGIMFFGLGLLCRYQLGGRFWQAAGGAFLLGLATVIWWHHVFTLSVFVILLSYRPLARKPWRSLASLFAAGCFFSLPFLCIAWQLWAIQSVLPSYHIARGGVNIPASFQCWLVSLLTKGNDQFFHYFSPIEAMSSFRTEPAMCAFRLARALFLSAQFFLLIIPFNIFILVASIRYYRNLRKTAEDDRARLVKRLLAAAALATVLSLLVFLGGHDAGKIRRCQFVIWVVLLVVGMEGIWGECGDIARRRLFKCVFWCAFASMLLAVMYSPKLITQAHVTILSPEDQSVIQFIENLPDHQHERFFLSADSIVELSPCVSFRGLVGHPTRPEYFHEEPVTGHKLFDAYGRLLKMTADWKDVASGCGVHYIILAEDGREPDRQLIPFYRRQGQVVLENRRWIVLKIAASDRQ
jgi:hypothetical protein